MANHRGGSGNFAEDRSAHQKQVKKVARAVTAKVTTSRTNQ
ncbi:Uncharacterised protein [Escherichia coli]|nr:Uncharacterised protein [Escherichia coli]